MTHATKINELTSIRNFSSIIYDKSTCYSHWTKAYWLKRFPLFRLRRRLIAPQKQFDSDPIYQPHGEWLRRQEWRCCDSCSIDGQPAWGTQPTRFTLASHLHRCRSWHGAKQSQDHHGEFKWVHNRISLSLFRSSSYTFSLLSATTQNILNSSPDETSSILIGSSSHPFINITSPSSLWTVYFRVLHFFVSFLSLDRWAPKAEQKLCRNDEQRKTYGDDKTFHRFDAFCSTSRWMITHGASWALNTARVRDRWLNYHIEQPSLPVFHPLHAL